MMVRTLAPWSRPWTFLTLSLSSRFCVPAGARGLVLTWSRPLDRRMPMLWSIWRQERIRGCVWSRESKQPAVAVEVARG